jgi:Family of unknown function (DUF6448)
MKDSTMKTLRLSNRLVVLALALLAILTERVISYSFGIDRLLPGLSAEGGLLLAWAIGHCDNLDGPVVTLARKALETNNVNHVLPWVRREDEHEIRHAFDHCVAVRQLGPRARALADRHFFETLVRVHRASEGAPYTGLKPAGSDLGPAVAAADEALETGLVKKLAILLIDAVRSGVHRHFQATIERRDFAPDDVAAGREYVGAYESYVHYVERLWEAAMGAAHGHYSAHAGNEREHAPHVH